MKSTAEIKLEGNPTTGFTWEYTVEDSSVVDVEESTEYLGKEDVCGAPSMFTWKLKGLKEGTTSITFVYRRSWETDVEPIETEKYQISVNNNLKVDVNPEK